MVVNNDYMPNRVIQTFTKVCAALSAVIIGIEEKLRTCAKFVGEIYEECKVF